jgi:hypothetical protein
VSRRAVLFLSLMGTLATGLPTQAAPATTFTAWTEGLPAPLVRGRWAVVDGGDQLNVGGLALDGAHSTWRATWISDPAPWPESGFRIVYSGDVSQVSAGQVLEGGGLRMRINGGRWGGYLSFPRLRDLGALTTYGWGGGSATVGVVLGGDRRCEGCTVQFEWTQTMAHSGDARFCSSWRPEVGPVVLAPLTVSFAPFSDCLGSLA